MGKRTTPQMDRPIFAMTIGDRIRKARQHAGLDRIELAERIGVAPTTVGNWERDNGEPRVSDAARIAIVTGVDFIDLCAPWELNPQPAEKRGADLIDLVFVESDDTDTARAVA